MSNEMETRPDGQVLVMPLFRAQDRAAYVEAARETGDPALLAQALKDVARAAGTSAEDLN